MTTSASSRRPNTSPANTVAKTTLAPATRNPVPARGIGRGGTDARFIARGWQNRGSLEKLEDVAAAFLGTEL